MLKIGAIWIDSDNLDFLEMLTRVRRDLCLGTDGILTRIQRDVNPRERASVLKEAAIGDLD